jgi:hypothetical protein
MNNDSEIKDWVKDLRWAKEHLDNDNYQSFNEIFEGVIYSMNRKLIEVET